MHVVCFSFYPLSPDDLNVVGLFQQLEVTFAEGPDII